MLRFRRVEELERLIADTAAAGGELSLANSIAAADAVGRIALEKANERLAVAAAGIYGLIPRGALTEAWSVMMSSLTRSPDCEALIKLIHPRVVEHVVARCFRVPLGRAGLSSTPDVPPEVAERLLFEKGLPAVDAMARVRFLELRCFSLAAEARNALERDGHGGLCNADRAVVD